MVKLGIVVWSINRSNQVSRFVVWSIAYHCSMVHQFFLDVNPTFVGGTLTTIFPTAAVMSCMIITPILPLAQCQPPVSLMNQLSDWCCNVITSSMYDHYVRPHRWRNCQPPVSLINQLSDWFRNVITSVAVWSLRPFYLWRIANYLLVWWTSFPTGVVMSVHSLMYDLYVRFTFGALPITC